MEHPIGTLSKSYWGTKNTYYEQIVSPVHDQEGNLDGVVMAGINITEMVESQHHQKWASQQLAQKTKDIQTYIDNINYTLRVSKVRIVNYDPERHEPGNLQRLEQTAIQATANTLHHATSPI